MTETISQSLDPTNKGTTTVVIKYPKYHEHDENTILMYVLSSS